MKLAAYVRAWVFKGTYLLPLLLLACSDKDDSAPLADNTPSATLTPRATAVPTRTVVEATPLPQATQDAQQIIGLFVEPRIVAADSVISLPPRPASPFEPWDRETLVLYDVANMTETNLGPAWRPSFSPDGQRMAYNVRGSGQSLVRIVDLSSGGVVQEFESSGGLASFITDEHLYLPSSGSADVYDLSSGVVRSDEDLDDPVLLAKLQQWRGSGGEVSADGRYRLMREPSRNGPNRCQTDPSPSIPREVCEEGLFEQWTLEEIASGQTILAFRAYEATFATPRELVLATSPQCEVPDGTMAWCAEVLEMLRADDPPGAFLYEEAHGTSNIFLVHLASGQAEFVATASFAANTRVGPANWPLIANADHVVWTGSYCSQEAPGSTHVLNRTTGQVAQLDASLWVDFTPTGNLGVDPFGPKAILDIETFEWRVVLPDDVTDVVESPDGRYLAVGSVLGHGGLCG